MGQPQRVSSLDGAVVGDVDWLDDEDSGPWCVDDGVSIHVMKSRDIYDAVERGDLTPETKVWRDGRACWLAIAECHELTVEPSGIRRIERPQQPTEPPPDEEESEPLSARPALMLTTSFAIGLVIGALLYLPFAW